MSVTVTYSDGCKYAMAFPTKVKNNREEAEAILLFLIFMHEVRLLL